MLFNPRQDETGRDLLAAAAIIHRGGLCKGKLSDDDGRHCINGALLVAIVGRLDACGFEGRDRIWRAQERLSKSLGLSWGEWHYCAPVVRWNNAPERTADEVVDALCHAAGVNAEVLV